MTDVTRRGFLAQTAVATGVGVAGALGLHQLVLPRTQTTASTGTLASVSPASGATDAASTGTASASGASAAFTGSGAASGASPSPDTLSLGGGLSLAAPLIVHVRDLATAEISVMAGDHELVYRDPELVARLIKTAASAMTEA
jgi:hypothetical protein